MVGLLSVCFVACVSDCLLAGMWCAVGCDDYIKGGVVWRYLAGDRATGVLRPPRGCWPLLFSGSSDRCGNCFLRYSGGDFACEKKFFYQNG